MRLIFILFLCFIFVPAHAQNFSEGAIRQFYANMVAIYGTDEVDEVKLIAFYEKHYSENASFNINMTTNINPMNLTPFLV